MSPKIFTANDTLILQKGYNEYGQLTSIADHLSNETVSITYDSVGQMTRYASSGTSTLTETYTYDYRGNLQRLVSTGVVSRTDVFTYNSNSQGNLTQITTGSFICALGYDTYNRCTSETISINGGATVDTKTMTYRKEGTHGTSMVSQLQYRNGTRLAYTYDSMGNIATVKKNNVLVAKYTYDGLNRLVREDHQELNTTCLYTYDGNGNILSKETFAYTTGSVTSGTGMVQSYFYNNRDQLQSYNGQTFAYDAVGNPTTYQGKALTWNRGRKLVNFNGTTFTYDAQGKRIRKNSTAYYYNSTEQLLKSSDGMEYFYGSNGVMGFVYSGNKYIYRKNLQGDVIEILDSNGNSVVQYVYDAWGNCTVSTTSNQTLAQINPFRYRGYFYDVETGLYFLKTRYYDPTIGRFINMDSINYVDPESINGLNLYAYCGNNPVMYIDENGSSPKWWQWALVGIGVALVVGAVTVLTCGVGTSVMVGTVAGSILHGAAIGTLIGAGAGAIGGGIIGGAVTDWSMEGVVDGVMIGFGAGAIVGAIVGGTVGGIQYGWQQSVLGKARAFSSYPNEATELHHIVEQCQINKSGFSSKLIRNSNNEVRIAKSLHSKVSSYYSKLYKNTGMRFRNYLAENHYSLGKQYNIGIKILNIILKGMF